MEKPSALLIFFIVLDALLIVSLYIPTIVFLNIQPFQRGFFCNDESISYPFRENTVPGWLMIFLSGLLPFICIILVEVYHYFVWKSSQWKGATIAPRDLRCFRLHAVIDNVIIGMAYFLAGWFLVLSFTNLGKVSIGRLRPHFLDVCRPHMSKVSCFYENSTRYRYVEDFECTGTHAYKLNDSRKSFPSGHASSSVYSAMFIAMYLQYRVYWSKVKFWKLFIQCTMIMLAILCGLSRVSDYKHHWSDVLIGSLLGIVVAIYIVIGVWKLDNFFWAMQRYKERKKQNNLEHRKNLKTNEIGL